MQWREIEKEMETKKEMLAQSMKEKEWAKGREVRVGSWRDFNSGSKKRRKAGVKRREEEAFGSGSGTSGTEYKRKWR